MSAPSRERRYARRLIPATIIYAIVMLYVAPGVADVRDPTLRFVLALLPMLPAILMIRAMVLRVMESDEFEQRVHLIALGVATAVVGTVSMAAGFLAAAHVITLDGIVLIWVFPALLMVYFAARTWTNLRHGVGVGEQLVGGLRRIWLSTLSFAALTLLLWPWVDAQQRTLLLALVLPLAISALALQCYAWRRARAGKRSP